MIFALVGNPNCGKTALFNRLTASRCKVGNFPGVTVEKKVGKLVCDKQISIVDLPGVYSLSPYTEEEKATVAFLLCEKCDCVINVIDGTDIKRGLCFSLRLSFLKIPTVIALNMSDEVAKNGGGNDTKLLSEIMKMPVVSVSAVKKTGLESLVAAAKKQAAERKTEIPEVFFGEMKKRFENVENLLRSESEKAKIPVSFAALCLAEKNNFITEKLGLSKDFSTVFPPDSDCDIAAAFFSFADNAVYSCVKQGNGKRRRLTEKLDGIFCDKYFALPVFVCFVFIAFYLTFGPFGGFLTSKVGEFISFVSKNAEIFLLNTGASETVISLFCDGIISGVGSVLSFVPVLLFLFAFISFAEESGYAARAALIFDGVMKKVGLSGRSVIPLLIGFGCSVPAIISSKGLSEKEKKRTVFAIPFMSCGAKITVYAAFIPVFFPKRAFPTVLFLYLLGVAVAVIYFCVRHSFGDKNAAEPYISELPPYRLPTLSDLFSRVFLRVGDFLSKAFGIILLSSVLVWFLTYFDFSLCHASPDESMLASVGKFVSPIFTFCGFSSWQAAAAIISGFLSKESVVATLFVLTGKTGGLPSVFPSPLSAMSFLIFVLLYPPCVAALSVLKRETGVFRTAAAVIFQFAAALILCSAFYGVSTLFS